MNRLDFAYFQNNIDSVLMLINELKSPGRHISEYEMHWALKCIEKYALSKEIFYEFENLLSKKEAKTIRIKIEFLIINNSISDFIDLLSEFKETEDGELVSIINHSIQFLNVINVKDSDYIKLNIFFENMDAKYKNEIGDLVKFKLRFQTNSFNNLIENILFVDDYISNDEMFNEYYDKIQFHSYESKVCNYKYQRYSSENFHDFLFNNNSIYLRKIKLKNAKIYFSDPQVYILNDVYFHSYFSSNLFAFNHLLVSSSQFDLIIEDATICTQNIDDGHFNFIFNKIYSLLEWIYCGGVGYYLYNSNDKVFSSLINEIKLPNLNFVPLPPTGVKVDNLVITSTEGRSAGSHVLEKFKFFKNLFPELNCKFGNKIYLSRVKNSRRKLLNEKELIIFLESTGFETYCLEDMTILEQYYLFAHARIIVSPHGAGLANMVFCDKLELLVEIMPSNRIVNGFLNIAANLNANYILFEGGELKFDEIYHDGYWCLDLNKFISNVVF